MNKQDLVAKVADTADIPKTKAEAAVNAVIDAIKTSLKKAMTFVSLVSVRSQLLSALPQQAVTHALASLSKSQQASSLNSRLVKSLKKLLTKNSFC